jgi:hypothetical protein
MTTSAPSPPVRARTSPGASPGDTASAPNEAASERRASIESTAIAPPPKPDRHSSAISPTGPQPSTTIVSASPAPDRDTAA